MTIERGSEARYSEALELIRNFYRESLSEYGLTFDDAFIVSNFDKYKDNAFLLIVDGKCEGVMAGLDVKSPLNNDRVFQEVIWYVNEKYRSKGVLLLKKAQEILKSEGYASMVMVCLHNSKTDKLFKFYEKMGYKPLETHFIKPL
jgi:GNAT superfamily N-acetyltransferase